MPIEPGGEAVTHSYVALAVWREIVFALFGAALMLPALDQVCRHSYHVKQQPQRISAGVFPILASCHRKDPKFEWVLALKSVPPHISKPGQIFHTARLA